MRAPGSRKTRTRTIPRRNSPWFAYEPNKAFWLVAIFASLVFLMGGGSRFDITSIGPLRAIAAVVLAVGIWFQTRETIRPIVWPLVLLGALAVWMIVQLIPLPSDFWRGLADREAIAQADDLLGMSDQSRPITLSPLRTWNSLAALIVPLAALVMLALLDRSGWRKFRQLIIIAGVASAILGAAQVIIPNAPGLYLYRITNADSAVGLFSNRNHNALFLNIALLFTFFSIHRARVRKSQAEVLLYAVAAFVLVLGILINASRFGLVLMVASLGLFAISQFWLQRRKGKSKAAFISLGLAGVVLLGLGAVFANAERIPAIERFVTNDVAEDQRADALPTVWEMAQAHFPYGLGFGAFEQGYRINEPVELLSSRYFNHAHNDWLQILVEGGLPAVLLLAIGLVFLLRQIVRRLWQDKGTDKTLPLLGTLTLGMIALHSLVDYPLRTPSIMLIAAAGVVMLLRAPESDRA